MNVLDMGRSIKYQHGGEVAGIPENMVLRAGENFILLVTDEMTITGCTFILQNGQSSLCTTLSGERDKKGK